RGGVGRRMTEAKWLSSEYVDELIDHLKETGRADARKLRLFACALARVFWEGFGHETHGRVVELAEEFADGRGRLEELGDAGEVAAESPERYETEYDGAEICPGRVAFETASEDAADAAWWADSCASYVCGYLPVAPGADRYDGAGLLREVF